ncbi:MAG: hypothetical protein KDD89_10700, partial [Anaerolineales bacterium]|nr:hypothetical protein [Anaerolineales bacterium]
MSSTTHLASAISDYQRARRKADLEQIMARFTGRSTDLLSYEDVRKQLKASKQIDRGLQDIPLDNIVGSVGRYKDFTRTFLPKDTTNEQRWARVLVANSESTGLPPIDVYQLGEAYFVLDGNHRVSIAREMGFATIQAKVTEVVSKVPITPDLELDGLIIKAEYIDFLERTHIDELRPEADLTVTAPGKYERLLEHVEAHQYFMGLDFDRDVAWDEAVAHWYDEVYLPVIHMVRRRGIMETFPNRTETDFYIWLAEHREELEFELGWTLDTAEAVEDLARQSGVADEPVARYQAERRDPLLAAGMEMWPPPARFRMERLAEGAVDTGRLFHNVLVSVGEDELSWQALEQATIVAQKEHGRVRGLHIINEDTDQVEMLEAFDSNLSRKNLSGELAFDTGDLFQEMVDRARWNDLLVMSLQHRPTGQVLERWRSGWRNFLIRTPRPVFAVPGEPSPLNAAVLAYDGSPKADEALYIATYIAGFWQTRLVVLTIAKEEGEEPSAQKKARTYLESHNITAEYIAPVGKAAINILLAVEKHNCDFIIMGGYGSNQLVELF